LRLLTQRDVCRPAGEFRPEKVGDFLEASIAEGLASGFTGVLVAAEMAWALGPDPGSEQLAAYEELVSGLVPGRRAAAICQYKAPQFLRGVVRETLCLHPVLQMPLGGGTDVGALRQRAWARTEALGFPPGDLTLMWTVISELARNTIERGRRGELILRRIEANYRVGLRVTVRVQGAKPTADDLLPCLSEIARRLDDVELSDAGGAAMISITKWVPSILPRPSREGGQ
jgi:hypothetical protein